MRTRKFAFEINWPLIATSVENGDHNGWHKINDFGGVLSFPTYQNQEMLDLVLKSSLTYSLNHAIGSNFFVYMMPLTYVVKKFLQNFT